MSEKLSRAEQARLNGAKSKGPKTPHGLQKSKEARYKHGLFAVQSNVLPTEPAEAYEAFRASIRIYWLPAGDYETIKVEQLTQYHWEISRLSQTRLAFLTDTMGEVRKNQPHIADTVTLQNQTIIRTSVPGGTIDHLDARVRRFNMEISRLERDLLRLKKYSPGSGSTQMVLLAKERPNTIVLPMPEPEVTEPTEKTTTLAERPGVFTEAELAPVAPPGKADEPKKPEIVEWAKAALNVDLDKHQAKFVTDPSNRIMFLAARQTGKSTAAAIKAVYEAVHHDNATVLLASPSGRQSGQIMTKAKGIALRLGQKLSAAPPECDGFQLPNGSLIISIPDRQSTIRGFSDPRLIIIDEASYATDKLFPALFPMTAVSNGAVILISTPNGQNGFFYEQWHDEKPTWSKHKVTASDCPRLSAAALAQIRKTMAKDEYAQEFECKFVAADGQIISRELFRSCLRDDFEPFFPEYEAMED